MRKAFASLNIILVAVLCVRDDTEEQYQMLADMGCMLFQGYFIARPMDTGGFEAFVRNEKAE